MASPGPGSRLSFPPMPGSRGGYRNKAGRAEAFAKGCFIPAGPVFIPFLLWLPLHTAVPSLFKGVSPSTFYGDETRFGTDSISRREPRQGQDSASGAGGSGKAAAADNPPVAGGPREQRTTESILGTIKLRTPELRSTYAFYWIPDKRLKGRLSFRFTIDPAGKVVQLDLVENTTGNDRFAASIRDLLLRWEFGRVKEVRNDVVTVPFTFFQ